MFNTRKHIVLALFSAASVLPHYALAAPNQVYVEQAAGNTFGHDLYNGDTNKSNLLFGRISGGAGNNGYVQQNNSTSTVVGFGQYGSGNSSFVTLAPGSTGSKSQVYQGNSPIDAAINGYAINVANNNDAYAAVAGTNNDSLVVQKGDQNVTSSALGGNNSKLLVVQEMREVPASGPIYKRGNDSQVAAVGDNNSVSVNQYQGNVSKVNVQGNGNKVKVAQANNLFTTDRKYNNVSVVNQNGTQLTADINQNGAGELATVTQTGGSSAYGGGNAVAIEQQHGGGNAQVTQTGTGQSVAISQSGTALAQVTQSGAASAGNSAIISQVVGSAGRVNTVVAPQSGIGNRLAVQQVYENGHSGGNSVRGDGSFASLVPSWTTIGGWIIEIANPNDQAWVGQQGNNNSYTINQYGFNSQAYYQQLGSNNSVTIDQHNDSQYARTNQIGDNNVIDIDQIGSSGYLCCATNMVDSLQQGNGNSLTVTQNQPAGGQGNSNHLYASQIHDGNTIQVSQTGATVTKLIQNGNSNGIVVSQNNAAGGYATGTTNAVQIVQLGNGNNANVVQNGTNHNLTLSQQGNGLSFSLTQNGAGKSIGITQTNANPNLTYNQ